MRASCSRTRRMSVPAGRLSRCRPRFDTLSTASGQPPRPAVQLRHEVEVRVAVHRGLDGPADRALEAEHELEPEGQVGRHDGQPSIELI